MNTRKILNCFDIKCDKQYILLEEEVRLDLIIENKRNITMDQISLMSDLADFFCYIDNSFEIDEIPFFIEYKINDINLDKLEVKEKIKFSYLLKLKQMFDICDIKFQLKYKLNNKMFYEVHNLKFYYNYKEINNHKLEIQKIPSKVNVILGEIFEYSINIKNTGSINIKKIWIYDILSNDLETLSNEIFINNIKEDASILSSGIFIRILEPESCMTITYNVRLSNTTKQKKVKNLIRYSYEYQLDKEVFYFTDDIFSKAINVFNPNVKLSKIFSESGFNINDEIDFSIEVKNDGSILLNNVIIFDDSNNYFDFISGYYYISNEKIFINDMEKGINIGTLELNETKYIFYRAKVKNVLGLNEIYTNLYAIFQYRFSNSNEILQKKTELLESIIKINNPLFDVYYIENTINYRKGRIKEVLSINSNIKIIEFVTFDTANEHLKGNSSFDKKLFIKGIITRNIIYNTCDDSNNTFVLEKFSNFREYLELPNNYNEQKKINLHAEIKTLTYRAEEEVIHCYDMIKVYGYFKF